MQRLTTAVLTASLLLAGTGTASAAPGEWRPSSPPTASTWVVLESSPGDHVGAGQTHHYTTADVQIGVQLLTGRDGFVVDVHGDEQWSGGFQVPDGEQLDERLYDGATRYPFNGAGPGLSWSGEGRGCNQVDGWFQVDGFAIDEATGEVLFLQLRFEQWCDGSATPLHGAVRFDANAPDPGPANPRPVPAGLWAPSPGDLPADDAPVVYLDSTPGDFIGGGRTWLHTGDEVTVGNGGNHRGLHVDVDPVGDGWWDGDFAPPDGEAGLDVGWYGDLQRFPFHNPRFGGLRWTGFGRGCNTVEGWFSVDELATAPDGTIEVLSLRFQQHCGTVDDPPLRGVVQIGIDRTPPDTVAPSVTITSGPADRTKATDATFTFVADEQPVTFTCRLDDGPAAPCTSPTTSTALAGGDHVMAVVATDAAGNVGEPATWSWTVKGRGARGGDEDDGGGGGKGRGRPKR